jgi:hypothetical protein
MHWLRSRETSRDDASTEANRRSRGRVRMEGVESNLGSVLDLSATGARVLSDRQHQGVVSLEIRTFDESLKSSAEIVWTRKVAHRQFLIGLRLLELTAEDQRKLAKIASSHRPRDAS